MRTSVILGVLALLAGCSSSPLRRDERPNVLFVAVDDLRPELSILGGRARTPHLDRLANQGLLFRNHMAVVPTCGASRRAMLTGRFPTAALLNNDACAKLAQRDHRAPTWPELLRDAGWRTACIGKISHSPDGLIELPADPPGVRRQELPEAWDEIGFDAGPWGTAEAAFFGYEGGATRRRGQSPPLERGSAGASYPDALLAEQACASLTRLADGEDPFLLAVGFFKPHLPFAASAEAWEAVTGRSDGISERLTPPEGFPRWATHGSGELLGNYGGHPDGRRIDEDYARSLREGYLACIESVDAEIGRLLAAAESLQDDRPLLVVLWSDHGWHLGDRGVWGKHTLFDEALRCPLILAGDGLEPRATIIDDVVSSLDVAPTILAACGVAPALPLDGQDLAGYLTEGHAGRNSAPSAWRSGPWRGSSIRTSEGRLTRWQRGEEVVLEPAQAIDGDGLAGQVGPEELRAALAERIWPIL